MLLESRHLAANPINQQVAAVRRLAHEAADAGLLSLELAAGISRVKESSNSGFASRAPWHLILVRSHYKPLSCRTDEIKWIAGH